MTYVAWAVLYEGETDASYLDVIIPRLMEDLVRGGTKLPTIPTTAAVRLRRAGPKEAAKEACAASDAFHFVFIHADAGGRNQAAGLAPRSTAYCEAMTELCGWPTCRCIVIAPRHETEAWALADGEAVTSALGYRGTPESIGLPGSPAEAERLGDPKAVLQTAVATVRRGRRTDPHQIFPAIAQRQRLELLRQAPSFQVFEADLRRALDGLGCL